MKYKIITFLLISNIIFSQNGHIKYGYIEAFSTGNANGSDYNAYMNFNKEQSYYVTAKDSIEKAEKINEQKTYSQTKVIKSKLKTQSEITKILEVLKNKKLSVNELKVYIDNLKKSTTKDEPLNKNIFDKVSFYSKKLSKKVYSGLSNEDKFFIDSKLKDIEKLYLEINSKIKE